jgi:hypothetical protein
MGLQQRLPQRLIYSLSGMRLVQSAKRRRIASIAGDDAIANRTAVFTSIGFIWTGYATPPRSIRHRHTDERAIWASITGPNTRSYTVATLQYRRWTIRGLNLPGNSQPNCAGTSPPAPLHCPVKVKDASRPAMPIIAFCSKVPSAISTNKCPLFAVGHSKTAVQRL